MLSSKAGLASFPGPTHMGMRLRLESYMQRGLSNLFACQCVSQHQLLQLQWISRELYFHSEQSCTVRSWVLCATCVLLKHFTCSEMAPVIWGRATTESEDEWRHAGWLWTICAQRHSHRRNTNEKQMKNRVSYLCQNFTQKCNSSHKASLCTLHVKYSTVCNDVSGFIPK